MSETCERETCFCCGRGHFCEPPRYPVAAEERWTCPECGTLHSAYDPHAEGRLSANILKHIPHGTLGWRATPEARDE